MKYIPKILLVEDNEGDIELTIEALGNNATKSEIIVINNGEDAIEYLKLEGNYITETLPDLILLDLNLPKVDGREVLNFVKQSSSLKKIPIVMLTTSSLQADITYSYDHHANCYIVKSENLNEFNNAIRSLENFWIQYVTYPSKN